MATATGNLGISPDAFWHKPTIMRPANDPIQDIVIDVQEGDEADAPKVDDGGALKIPTADGGVIVDFSGRMQPDGDEDGDEDESFDANLALDMGTAELSTIAEDLLEGIDADKRSREEWIATRDRAIDLLGLKLDPPRSAPGGGAAPLEGMSTAKDPTLTDAVIRGQATAIGEFLPADGPAKIEDVGDDQQDELAEALENDFNHYLTSIATEYYPDTKRMLAWTYFGGCGVKKVYPCPLRRRPVSESVEMQDFLVSNAATDLENADRVTHIIEMRRSRYRRLVAAEYYLDVEMDPLGSAEKDRVTQKLEMVEGVRADSQRPEDQPYTFYEVVCERSDVIDNKVPKRLRKARVPAPYLITIEKDSRRIVSIYRHWKEDDEDARKRRMYVKWSYIDWIGFYGLGLLHVIGNLTLALTAMLRIGIDKGMFANFPGGVKAKGIKQLDNDIIVGPGQFPDVDVSMIPDGDIKKAVMPLPYSDLTQGFMQLMDKVREFAKQVGGTADMPISEGRADIPVGTILALIEQSTKVESAVHKGMHVSQSEEFELLIELFREDPEALWRHKRKKRAGSGITWDEQKLLRALDDFDLVPKSDPNTPSHLHRIMRAVALVQMAEGAATKGFTKFDMKRIYQQALTVLRYQNVDQYFTPDPPPGAAPPPPDPKLIDAQAKDKMADAKTLDVQTKAQTAEQNVKEKLLSHVSDEKVAATRLATEKVIHEHDREKFAKEHSLATQDQQHQHGMDKANLAVDAAKAAHEAAISAHEATKPEPEPAA